MTVKDLIWHLQKIEQPDAMVVVRGYEGGVNDVEVLLPQMIARDCHRPGDYYGCHEVVENPEERSQAEQNNHKIVPAILLRVKQDYLDEVE